MVVVEEEALTEEVVEEVVETVVGQTYSEFLR